MNIIDQTTEDYRDHRIVVTWERDDFMCPPWEEHDGCGIVSDWTSRDKRPGERVLSADRSSRRYYDFEGTIRRATKDGWGLSDESLAKLANELQREPTKKEIIAKAVERDFEYLRGWCNDEWCWCVRSVEIQATKYSDSLCGIDGTEETIKSYTAEAIREAKAWLDNELAESQDAACRDIVTV
jgi:hypothetical protein